MRIGIGWTGIAGVALALAACGDDAETATGGEGGGTTSGSTAVLSASATATSGPSSGNGGGTGGEGVTTGDGGGGEGQGGDGGGEVDPYVPPEGGFEACQGFWGGLVPLLVECFGPVGEYFYGAPDVVDRLAANCEQLIYRGGLTVAEQETCNAAIAELETCEDLEGYLNFGVEACTATVFGDKPVGSECISNYECSTAVCLVPPDSTCGTCAEDAGEDGVCDDVSVGCGPYLNCVQGTCQAEQGVLGPCDDVEVTCQAGLSCIDGACQAPIPEDGDCNPQATTYECATGTYCNSISGVCAAMPVGDLGDECGLLPSGELGVCSDGNRCHITNLNTYTGECEVPTEDGGACSTQTPILFTTQCAYPSSCFDQVCQPGSDYLTCF